MFHIRASVGFVCALTAVFASPAFGAFAHGEGWDNSTLAGWDSSSNLADVSVMPAGGTPQGYVECCSAISTVVGVQTPSDDWTGNLAAAGITGVTVDLKFQLGNYTDARLRFRYQDSFSNGWTLPLTTDLAANNTWQHCSVSFDPTWTDTQAIAAGWFQETCTPSFAETMADVYTSEVRLTGSDVLIAGVDNFTLVPEPASIGLLALSGLAMLRRRNAA